METPFLSQNIVTCVPEHVQPSRDLSALGHSLYLPCTWGPPRFVRATAGGLYGKPRNEVEQKSTECMANLDKNKDDVISKDEWHTYIVHVYSSKAHLPPSTRYLRTRLCQSASQCFGHANTMQLAIYVTAFILHHEIRYYIYVVVNNTNTLHVK